MKRKTDFSKDVQVWIDFAKYDLKTAKWNLEGEIYTSSCYAAQQAGEKALKAMILDSGIVAPKIHSLDRLISILKSKKIVVTAEIEDCARRLDKFYITTRYPGQYGGPEGLYDKTDAQSAVNCAETILNFVITKIDKS